MAVVTIADVLKHAEQFERKLAGYYAELSEHATREGVRMLADYMSRHRRRIQQALEELSDEQARRICSTSLPYEPEAPDWRRFEQLELSPDATAAQVLDQAIQFDQRLVEFYKQMLEQPLEEDILELLRGLISAEEGDEIELKKIKAMDYF
jgi:rubrerythrin